jgi:hypothetical protein
MINTYNDDMYNYLTEAQNYTHAQELSENLAQVDKRLRDEFWEEVTELLKMRISENYDFKFISKQEDANCEWFQIIKNDWGFYYISTDGEDIGIKMIESKKGILGYKESIIKEQIEMKSSQIGTYKNLNWLCWKTFNNYRFQTKEAKMQILPHARSFKVKDCANDIYNYLEKILSACTEINKIVGQSEIGSYFPIE